MANYNLIVDTSNFKPFNIDNYFKLIDYYNKGYEKNQAVYDAIGETLSNLSSAVLNSPKAKELYDMYNNRFNTAAEDFASDMTTINSRELAALRKLYNSDILRLEKARKRMAEINKALKETYAKDPSILFEDLGILDEYVDDEFKTPKQYSGDLLTKETLALVQAAGNSIVDAAITGHLDPYTYKILKRSGYSKEDINNLITQVSQGGIEAIQDSLLKSVYDTVLDASGIKTWNNADTILPKALKAMNKGALAGIGKQEITHAPDEARKKALDWKYDKMKMDYQWQLNELAKDKDLERELTKEAQKNADKLAGNGLPRTTRVPIHFDSDVDEDEVGYDMRKLMANDVLGYIQKHKNDSAYMKNVYKRFFVENGNWKVDPITGKRGYFDSQKAYDYLVSNGSPLTSTDLKTKEGQRFKNFLKEKGYTDNLIDIWLAPNYKDKTTVHMPTPNMSTAATSGYSPTSTVTTTKWDDKNWNDLAKQNYRGALTWYTSEQGDLKEYLRRDMKVSSGTVPFRKYLGVDKDGNLRISNARVSVKDIPTDSDGNIDWGSVTRMGFDNDFNFIFEVLKGTDDTQLYVVLPSDLSLDAVAEQRKVKTSTKERMKALRLSCKDLPDNEKSATAILYYGLDNNKILTNAVIEQYKIDTNGKPFTKDAALEIVESKAQSDALETYIKNVFDYTRTTDAEKDKK